MNNRTEATEVSNFRKIMKSFGWEKSLSGEKSFGGEKSFYFFMYLFRVLEHSKHFIKFFLFASEIPGTKSDYFEEKNNCQQNGTEKNSDTLGMVMDLCTVLIFLSFKDKDNILLLVHRIIL